MVAGLVAALRTKGDFKGALSEIRKVRDLGKAGPGQVHYHHYQDFRAGIASGSFLTAGMAICPCSMGTAAAIAHGLSQNLIHRAADVHLKEKRKLVLVPREAPLSIVQLRNLTICAEVGAALHRDVVDHRDGLRACVHHRSTLISRRSKRVMLSALVHSATFPVSA